MSQTVSLPSGNWTHEDRTFVAHYVESGNASQAAMQAYGIVDPITASRRGNAFLKANRHVFDMVMDREGLTDRAIVKTIAEGMSAMKRTYAKHQGEMGEHADDVDHRTRLDAAKLGAQLRGHLDKQRTDDDDDSRELGPVILPVREGMELPATAEIIEALADDGGDTKGPAGTPDVPDIHNASTSPVGGFSGENKKDESEDEGDW